MKLKIGDKVGRLTVLKKEKRIVANHQRNYCYCKCDCGVEKWIREDGISADKRGVQSCGCYGKEDAPNRSKTHGWSKNSTYKIWKSMFYRCYQPKNQAYPKYGGRGIKICDRWRDSFENFLADMGERPSKKHSLDRIDVDGDYCPENCRWATWVEQENNRRNNVNLSHNGETHTLSEWSRILGLPLTTIGSRYYMGKSIEEILSPIKKNYINR